MNKNVLNDFLDDNLETNQFARLRISAGMNKSNFFNTKSAKKILENLIDTESNKWVNNAKKGSGHETPDFVNESDQIMMELMTVDDIKIKKNKNIQKQRESESKKQLIDIFGPELVKGKKIITNPDTTDIPTDEHHNYNSYVKNSLRIIDKHIQSIPTYQKNHPNYKLIFLICDESTSYVQGEKYGDKVDGKKVHKPYLDRQMVQEFKGTKVDYLVWYKMNEHPSIKKITYNNEVPVAHQISVLDLKNLSDDNFIDYEKDSMVSLEK